MCIRDRVYTIHGQIDFVFSPGWEAADAAPWGALDAYQRHDESGAPTGSYLLCYENRIVEIRFDEMCIRDRALPMCIGPVGLAETNSTMIFCPVRLSLVP